MGFYDIFTKEKEPNTKVDDLLRRAADSFAWQSAPRSKKRFESRNVQEFCPTECLVCLGVLLTGVKVCDESSLLDCTKMAQTSFQPT